MAEEKHYTPINPDNPQLLFSWKAPLRPYKKRGKRIVRFYLAVALLLSLLIFFLGDPILLIPIWALLFLFYILTITPPPEIDNTLTLFGIETTGITIRWEALSHFYFTERLGFTILTIVSNAPYYLHAYLVIPDNETKEKVMKILAAHILYKEKPQRTFTDKMIDLLLRLIPEDEEDEKEKVSAKTTPPPASSPEAFSPKPAPASL